MILFYAPGDGLGHLTRVRSVVHTLQLKDQLAVMTDAEGARRILPDADIIPLKTGVRAVLKALRPEAVYVDAFPAGIQGELSGLQFEQPAYYVARLLQWQFYCAVAGNAPPAYDCTYILESLSNDHYRALTAFSRELRPIILADPVSSCETPFHMVGQQAVWLIVHSGPVAECEELVGYARDMARMESANPAMMLIAQRNAAGLPAMDFYPAHVLFPSASRIITACGFNSMRQTEAYAARHRFLPFLRRYDDQFRRAATRRSSNALPAR